MPWYLREVTAFITVTSWSFVCATSLLCANFWYLFVSVLMGIDVLIQLMKTIHRVINYFNGIICSPFIASKTGGCFHQLDKGLPTWLRRQMYIISTIALSCEESDVMLLYITCSLLICSSLLLSSALLKVDEHYGIELTYATQFPEHTTVIKLNKILFVLENCDVADHLHLYSLIAAMCIFCFAYNCIAMYFLDLLLIILFACIRDTKVELTVKRSFLSKYPYVLDGMGHLIPLGILVILDLLACGRLFFLAYYSDASVLLVTATFCNAFAAVLELHRSVWRPFSNERAFIESMRWASKEELSSHNDVCAVCLLPMASARVTVCGHLFHGKCIRLTLIVSTMCPLCQSTLLPHEYDFEFDDDDFEDYEDM